MKKKTSLTLGVGPSDGTLRVESEHAYLMSENCLIKILKSVTYHMGRALPSAGNSVHADLLFQFAVRLLRQVLLWLQHLLQHAFER